MKLVTNELMREIDRATIAGSVEGAAAVESLDLMERAGAGIAEAIYSDFFAEAEKKRVAIFCGKGNNGGDGLVVARYLAAEGCFVTVYLVGERGELPEDSQTNYDRLSETKVKINLVGDIGDLPDRLATDLIVDALLGSGVSGAPRGLALDLIRYINQQDETVCSIDNPTGLDSDSGKALTETVVAEFTYTLGLPKRGHYLNPGKQYVGTAQVIDIGIPEVVVNSFAIKEHLITPEQVFDLLPARPAEAHKGVFGRLYLLAGSRGMTGAGALAAEAAMRSGIGLATLGCPDTLADVYEIKLNEVMTQALPSVGKRGALALRGLGAALSKLNSSEAAVIGPGLGRHRDTEELVRRLINKAQKPVVIDADALNALEKDASALEETHVACVLTPHPGEFKRLTGVELADDFSENAEAVRTACARFHSVIALKGDVTIVGEPGGDIFVNPLGNSGMATGGSGDVLAGVIGAMLAQGLSALDAALVGVFLHSLAGDLAAAEIGERSLIAGDIVSYLPLAFEVLEE